MPGEAIIDTIITDDVAAAAAALRSGNLVAFPTETVYGLGADASNADAIARIFTAKGRPADNPLIVHLADREQISSVASSVPAIAERLLDAFAPGPITVVLPRSRQISEMVSAGLDTVGVRIPAHPVAHAFLAACRTAVAAPSANRSGRPSPTTWEAVQSDLAGRIECVLRGPRSRVGLESTVVDCTGPDPVVLRAGTVTLEELQRVAETTRLATPGDDSQRSPGTRHPHYAPSAIVIIVSAPGNPAPDAAYIGLSAPASGYGLTVVAHDAAEYAHALYDLFRRADAAGMVRIDCESIALSGIGRALMDRVSRAAGQH